MLMQAGDESSRVCTQGAGGSCGRPFLIHGEAALASPCERADWQQASLPELDLGVLSPTLRARVAGWWHAALMEHARFLH